VNHQAPTVASGFFSKLLVLVPVELRARVTVPIVSRAAVLGRSRPAGSSLMHAPIASTPSSAGRRRAMAGHCDSGNDGSGMSALPGLPARRRKSPLPKRHGVLPMCFPALQWRSPDARKCLRHKRLCERYPLCVMQRPSSRGLAWSDVDGHGLGATIGARPIDDIPDRQT
jgi:hypothetical protein